MERTGYTSRSLVQHFKGASTFESAKYSGRRLTLNTNVYVDR